MYNGKEVELYKILAVYQCFSVDKYKSNFIKQNNFYSYLQTKKK